MWVMQAMSWLYHKLRGPIERKDSMPGLSFILQTLAEHCEIRARLCLACQKISIWSWGSCYDQDYSVHKEPRHNDSMA